MKRIKILPSDKDSISKVYFYDIIEYEDTVAGIKIQLNTENTEYDTERNFYPMTFESWYEMTRDILMKLQKQFKDSVEAEGDFEIRRSIYEPNVKYYNFAVQNGKQFLFPSNVEMELSSLRNGFTQHQFLGIIIDIELELLEITRDQINHGQ